MIANYWHHVADLLLHGTGGQDDRNEVGSGGKCNVMCMDDIVNSLMLFSNKAYVQS